MDETRRALIKGAAYISAFGLPSMGHANEAEQKPVTPPPLEAAESSYASGGNADREGFES